mmetsp:Transcript_14949/g.41035  ORF Transcript_14949/g.41035 Transcript_14949/m.41035 type:complete len:212 (+) Transcript_14949:997-1632(+)
MRRNIVWIIPDQTLLGHVPAFVKEAEVLRNQGVDHRCPSGRRPGKRLQRGLWRVLRHNGPPPGVGALAALFAGFLSTSPALRQVADVSPIHQHAITWLFVPCRDYEPLSPPPFGAQAWGVPAGDDAPEHENVVTNHVSNLKLRDLAAASARVGLRLRPPRPCLRRSLACFRLRVRWLLAPRCLRVPPRCRICNGFARILSCGRWRGRWIAR